MGRQEHFMNKRDAWLKYAFGRFSTAFVFGKSEVTIPTADTDGMVPQRTWSRFLNGLSTVWVSDF
jgi:hypothetical protein